MERAHLVWMIERMQLAYYAKREVLASPQMGEAKNFFIIKQGLVHGARGYRQSGHGAGIA